MATINIRDLPDEVAASIDAATVSAGARSREAYLRDFLGRYFGAGESASAGIAARARMATEHAITLGHFGVLKPTPTVAAIARALGHADPGVFEAELRGDRAFAFTDGDRLCKLLSLQRDWFESGGHAPPRFATRAAHFDCSQLLYDLVENGVRYEELYLVLADGNPGDAAIIGHTESEDPEIGWRYDLLVDEIPIHDKVGGTGRAQRREFADLMVALFDDNIFSKPVFCIGRIVPQNAYDAMVSGYVHPATLTNTYAPGLAQATARSSHWDEDFWSFDRSESYTRSYAAGRAALLKELIATGITTNEAYTAHVRKMIRSWKPFRKSKKVTQ